MLFYGEEQISREELAKHLGVDLKQLIKKPSFENKKKKVDNINGGRIKSGAGYSRRSHFFIKDPKTGLDTILRYAKSATPNMTSGIRDFKPRYVDFIGAKKAFTDDLDLAFFFYLTPENDGSPLNFSVKPKPKYEFIDTVKRTEAKNSKRSALKEALNHAEELEYDQLILLAKGLGFKGVDKMDEDELRADVGDFAMNNPELYLNKSNTEVTFLEGRILNLVDNNVIVMTKHGDLRRWSWASGDLEGQVIVDELNVTADIRRSLINHIFNNFNKYNNAIMQANDAVSSRANVERAISQSKPKVKDEVGEDLPEHLRAVNNDDYVPAPPKVKKVMTKEEATEFLTERDGEKPHWKKVEKFLQEQ